MRKTAILIISAAFVAALPSIASAKSKHHRHHRHVAQPVYSEENPGPRFLANALHQIFVPLEVTLAPRTN